MKEKHVGDTHKKLEKLLKIGLEEIENSKKTQNDVKNQLQNLEFEKS